MKQLLQYAQEATSAPLARAGSAGDTATTHGEARTEGIGMRLMHINPMLEAFGNAATVCNDNSSRFGKYIGLSMDASGAMVSAELRTYLLETSRLTIRDDTELNFHIFYQLVQARSPPLCARRPLFRCLFDAIGCLAQDGAASAYLDGAGPSTYRYLDAEPLHAEGFAPRSSLSATLDALHKIGIDEEETENIVRVLCALLLIGQIDFTATDGISEPGTPLARVAALLELPTSKLREWLSSRTFDVNSESVRARSDCLSARACSC
jgi:myosin heavy subunit